MNTLKITFTLITTAICILEVVGLILGAVYDVEGLALSNITRNNLKLLSSQLIKNVNIRQMVQTVSFNIIKE